MFSNNSERDIHLFQDGSRKEGMHHGSRLAEQAGKLHARVWRLESSQWTAHFLPPVPRRVPAPWSKFIELINSFSYLSSLGVGLASLKPGHRVYGKCVNVC